MQVSRSDVAEKAAQDPQLPWFLTAVTRLESTELTEAGADPRLSR